MSSKLEVIKHTIVLKEPKVEMIRSTLGRQKKQSIRRKVTSAQREIHSLFTPTTDTLTTGTQIAQSVFWEMFISCIPTLPMKSDYQSLF